MHPLFRFRSARHLSLAKLAAISGVSKTSLSRIERGEQATTEATIRKLMKASGGVLSANDFIAPLPNGEGGPAVTSGPEGDHALGGKQ